MFILAAAALAATSANVPSGTAVPKVEAWATVRIISGASIRFDQARTLESPYSLRTAVIRLPDGSTQQAKLVEFE